MIYKTGLGQDSHRFEENIGKPLVLGGYEIRGVKGLNGNSDADVIFHAITNAISGVTGQNILGIKADELCKKGITDSKVYLREAVKTLEDWKICHISISMEGAYPKLFSYLPFIRLSISSVLNIPETSIGITVTSGEKLTAFGRGEGLQALCVLTVKK